MSGAHLRHVTPEHIARLNGPELADLRRELSDVIAKIREDMRELRASYLEQGDVPDRNGWYRRAAHASRMYGRLVSCVDARLRELREEKVAVRQLAAELMGEPSPPDLAYAAGVLDSAAAAATDQRIGQNLVRVATWLRREADQRRALEDATSAV